MAIPGLSDDQKLQILKVLQQHLEDSITEELQILGQGVVVQKHDSVLSQYEK